MKVASKEELTNYSTKQLVSFYNKNSNRPPIKKFTNRETAETKVWQLLSNLAPTKSKKSKAKLINIKSTKEIKPLQKKTSLRRLILEMCYNRFVKREILEEAIISYYIEHNITPKNAKRTLYALLMIMCKEKGYSVEETETDGVKLVG